MISHPRSDNAVESSLRPHWRAGIFLVVIVLWGLWLVVATVEFAIATTLAQSADISKLHRSLALDPANPRAHHRLGLLYSYSLQDVDPTRALQHLRRATELSPYDARYWMDFAAGSESSGDTATADIALQRALELRPMMPRFRWRAANYYLQTERPELAWPQFQRLLELSPGYAPAVFRLCLKASDDRRLILDRVLPVGPDPKLKLAYVDFLSARGELDFAHAVWNQTVAHARSFPFRQASPYLDRLLAAHRYKDAIGVWEDLVRLGVVTQSRDPDGTNLVFNGGFERPPLNAGFDWRASKADYLALDFEDPTAYEGAACLRLNFTVRHNAEHEAPCQFVAVNPNLTYQLGAYARSEGITSDSGPRLRVLDPACPSCLDVSSENTVGTTPWHRIGLTFSAGPDTRVVRLSIWRPRSRAFPTEITGSFWLDSVSLKPLGPLAKWIPHSVASQP